MRDLTKDLDFDAVGGLTLGADPVATSMLHAAAAAGERLDAVVRKAGKAHGLQQRIEGPSITGRRVLVVEDTTTTGASRWPPSRPPARTAPRWWPWRPSRTGPPPRASGSAPRPESTTSTPTRSRTSGSP